MKIYIIIMLALSTLSFALYLKAISPERIEPAEEAIRNIILILHATLYAIAIICAIKIGG